VRSSSKVDAINIIVGRQAENLIGQFENLLITKETKGMWYSIKYNLAGSAYISNINPPLSGKDFNE
jgi:hypothetical protein